MFALYVKNTFAAQGQTGAARCGNKRSTEGRTARDLHTRSLWGTKCRRDRTIEFQF